MAKIEQIGEIRSFDKNIRLDKKDRKILSLLMLDARINLSELSKFVELSKSNIARRIKKLEEEGFITGYHAYIDFSKIGIKSSIVLIKSQATFETKEDYIKSLISNKKIYAITEQTGAHDLMIAINYKSEEEKDLVLDNILDKRIIKDFEIFEIKTHFPKLDYTKEMPDKLLLKPEKPIQENADIDSKDIKILKALSENCRIPLVDLAEKLNLPRETLSYRIKKLTDSGVIAKFQPNVNFFMIGSEFYFLMFKLIHPSKKKDLIRYLSKTFRANTILESNGSYQVMAFVQFKDIAEFRNFEDRLFKEYKDSIQDHCFEIAKAQYKLDWFPDI